MAYEIKLPEGSGLDPADVADIATYGEEQKWTQEQFGEELGRVHKVVDAYKTRTAFKPPEKYELKLPENPVLDQKHVDAVAKIAKEKNWSQDQAQAVLDQRHEAAAEVIRTRNEAWKTEIDTGKAALKKEWGSSFDANLDTAKRGIDRIAPEGDPLRQPLVEFLTATGLGDNPVVAKIFFKIGQAIKEDAGPKGKPGEGAERPGNITDRFAESLYGSKA